MAKLSARGRTMLVSAITSWVDDAGRRVKREIRIMSDLKLLQKYTYPGNMSSGWSYRRSQMKPSEVVPWAERRIKEGWSVRIT